MLELGVLRELSKSASSGVTSVKKIIHLALDPGYADRVNQGITDCLGSHLHQYYPGVSGVLLGYEGVKLKKNAVMNRELPHIHLDIQATFYTFCPSPGSFLLGTVHKISEGHVGLWVHHVFYASILKKTEAAAVWAGSKLSVGDTVKFKVEAVSYIANRIIILGGSEDLEQSPITNASLQAKAASTRHKMIEHFPLATDKTNLGLKITAETSVGETIFTCQACGKSFNDKSNCRRHFKSKHISAEPTICTICYKSFKNKNSLKYHLKAIHWKDDVSAKKTPSKDSAVNNSTRNKSPKNISSELLSKSAKSDDISCEIEICLTTFSDSLDLELLPS